MNNFLEALSSRKEEKVELKKLERRLYHDEDGKPLFYTVDDLEGDYIVIPTEDLASARYDVLVKNGKLTLPEKHNYQKLTPQDTGTECYVNDVSIIGRGQYWSLKEYK